MYSLLKSGPGSADADRMGGARPWRRRLLRAAMVLGTLGVIGAIWFLLDWRRLPQPPAQRGIWIDPELTIVEG
jgi:hypothetical protein